MTETNSSGLIRSKLLTNSAAEYTETRADQVLGSEFARPTGAEFVPVLDQFRLQADVPRIDYYKESKDKLQEFKATLVKFSKTIKERELDKKLGITLKEPEEYQLKDVLQIAEKLHEKHRDASQVQSCTGAIRKCFRYAGENKGVLKKMLSFVPNDTYGSVICGAFTVILGAIDRADTLRKDIYAALAEVPRKLQAINTLTEVHYKSAELYMAADSVFVALFVVLERIVNELSKSMGKKALQITFKGEKYGIDIQEAVKSFEAKIELFKEQARMCDSQRLGRIENALGGLTERFQNWDKNRLQETTRLDQEYAEQRTAIEANPVKMIEDPKGFAKLEDDIKGQEGLVRVLNTVYKLLASSESFDPQAGRAFDRLSAPTSPGPSRSVTPEQASLSKKLAQRWLKRLPLDFDTIASKDVRESLKRKLRPTDEDKIQWIVSSDTLFEWLKAAESITLVIQGETAPMELVNSLSFSSAFMARTLARSYKSPVLYHSCGLRTEASYDKNESGAIALLNSLNSQLMRSLLKRPGMDLFFLEDRRFRRRSQESIRTGLRLMGDLLDRLPEGDTIFIIIDSLSRVGGSVSTCDAVLTGILELAEQSMATVKVLLTDLLSREPLVDRYHTELVVPDTIGGGGGGINISFLTKDTRKSISRLQSDSSTHADEDGRSPSGDREVSRNPEEGTSSEDDNSE